MKQNQIGSTAVAVAVALTVLVGIVALSAFMSYVGAYNLGNRSEVSLNAALTHNKNVLSQYTLKVKEAAQITSMQTEDLTKIVTAALASRYGGEGSKALFQFIKEQNPTLDQSTYKKLQDIIASGRSDFQIAQDELIDKKRVYETALGSFWTGIWLHMAGYPKINLADIKVITSQDTETKFESGRDDTVKLR